MITHRLSLPVGLSCTPVSRSDARRDEHGGPGWRSTPVRMEVA